MTRSMKQLLALFVVAVGVIAIAGVSGRAQGDEEMTAEDAARELMVVSGVEDQLIPVMKQSVRLQFQAMGDMANDVDIAVVDQWIEENITWADFESGFIEIYTDLFTRDELMQITAFQRSAAGKKSMALMPVLFERGGQLGLRVVQEKLPALLEMLEADENVG